ncbi:FUSC family protein [Streptomyces sp. NPDC021562]|uniref:FUSC family protein n=1 Tax=Streptomyces sp. NPDC021562 TaxID=3155121 RepID=UPI0033FD8EB1
MRRRDPDLAATRRAGRTAVVMPALFALCTEVLHSPTTASFAAFGSFSMLLLVDYSGPMVERLRAQVALALAWLVLICVGTLAGREIWSAVAATVVVGFLVLFAGVVSSVLAGSSTALLLAFVLPVSAPVPLSQLPDRLAGAGLAAAVALPAVALLWPRPVADPLSAPAAAVCRAAADYLHTRASLPTPNPPSTDPPITNPPRPDQPSTDPPGTDLRGTDLRGPDQPDTDPPDPDQPSTAPPHPNQPSTDLQCPDQPDTDPRRPDQPSTAPPHPDQPSTAPPHPNQPSTDLRGPDQPDTDPPHPNQPGTDLQGPDQPDTDPPHPDQPSTAPPHPDQPGGDLLGAGRVVRGGDLCRVAAERTARAGVELRAAFDATPYRPTGLSATSRALVRLVDELTWLCAVLVDRSDYTDEPPGCDPAAHTVRLAGALVLEAAADLLADLDGDTGPLRARAAQLRTALTGMEHSSAVRVPAEQPGGNSPAEVFGFIATLDVSFRAQELGFAVLQIADNVGTAASAWQRSWPERLLGREPGALTAPLAAARERARTHLTADSVWLHNSLRGAVGLGIAVFLAGVTGVEHSFWVLLGTLSVLRSNALSTGQNAVRAVLGTVAGSVIGAGLLQLIGHHGTALWFVLPVAVLLAGVAPAAVSFAAGQAAFTVTLVVLFNIGHDPSWHIALLRVQDIALGCAVSVVVAVFFWPRGARAAVHRALAEAYDDSARYLGAAVDYALGHSTPTDPGPQSRAAAASARRLDDAFRSYLAERGAKPLSLACTTTLVTGVVGLRLAADAVVSLWQGEDRARVRAVRADAHGAVLGSAALVTGWYHEFAASLGDHAPVPDVVPLRPEGATRLVASVRTELSDEEGRATPVAIRIIWTDDHVDAARRLQPGLADAAKARARARHHGTRTASAS